MTAGWEIREGHTLDTLRQMPDQTAQCCITSPPYWNLRDYGHTNQIGQESTPDQYVANLVEVFAEVRRVLRDDGTLWLNIGDTYNAYNGNSGPSKSKVDQVGSARNTQRPKLPKGHGLLVPDLKQKDLIGIPWLLAFALRTDGWYLRSEIVWAKPNPMPESVTDRPTKSHEQIFLLTKSPRYYYDANAIREPAVKGDAGSRFDTGKTATHQLDRAQTQESRRPGVDTKGGNQANGTIPYDGETRNRRSVWTIGTQPFKGAHFAVFPPQLVEPMIMAGTKPGDLVIDPFSGSGTTGLVALRHDRSYIGMELNPEYAELSRARIRDDAPLLNWPLEVNPT